MNIFIVAGADPVECAKQMIDKHVVKMPTESLQMISTIMDLKKQKSPFKPVMLNHPCTIWARETVSNYDFLVSHTWALCSEYTKRYGKKHRVEELLEEYQFEILNTRNFLPSGNLTPFAQAMPNKYKNDCAKTAYRDYYINEKWSFASWKYGEPDWWPKNHISNMKKERQQVYSDMLKRLEVITNEV